MTLTVYSVYCLVRNLAGPLSVYQRHCNHLLTTHSSPEPIHQWDMDLICELKHRILHGEQIIVGRGDFNDAILTMSLASTLQETGLQEGAVLSSHPSQNTSISTYIRSETDRIIDGILVTPSIQIERCGYTDFNIWDHHMVWLDISTASSTFGADNPHTPIAGCRLKLQDLSTVTPLLVPPNDRNLPTETP